MFEPLLSAEDAIISDALNHASIIDGIRLCKAKRYRFANSDMNELETRLKEADADGARFKLIATDGVFSMDGYVAKLKEICDLAERYGAFVLVDDCHAHGHLGERGRGTPALTGAGDRVQIVTGTLRQDARRRRWAASSPRRSRSSTSCASARGPTSSPTRLRRRSPPARSKAIDIAEAADDRRAHLMKLVRRVSAPGLRRPASSCLPGETPIIPVMLHEARRAQEMAAALDERGVYVAGLLLSRRAEGQGAHPHADVGGADARRMSILRSTPSATPAGAWSDLGDR